jgi:hypothetical protein
VFIRYYITVILDSVICQRKGGSPLKDFIMLTFFLAMTAIDGLTSVRHELDAYSTRLMTTGKFVIVGRYVSELFCDTFIFVYLFLAWSRLDETEVFRFVVYSVNIAFFIIISTTVSQIKVSKVSEEMNPILMMLEFLAQNFFVGMMNYVHWPCHELRTYANPNTAVSGIIMDEVQEEDDSI